MPTKHQRIISILEQHNLDGLLIRQVANFAWATDGAASYINTATIYGSATLLVTRNHRHIITNNIEAPRFELEEKLKEAGWEFHIGRWYLESDALLKLTKGLKLGADYPYLGAVDLSSELSIIRSYLDDGEQARFRKLSCNCALAMDEAIRTIRPGMTEHQIAGTMAGAVQSRGAQPIVNLVASDERIFKYRHPLPTHKAMDQYAMMVLCGRQQGLVCSITRLVHFGALPDELREKSEAVAAIDAAMIAATRPGVRVGDVFETAIKAYTDAGYPDEYQLHHQGGPAGYDPREYIAKPTSKSLVAAGQAYAWNPSITGCKSEDTILVTDEGFDIMTEIKGWPTIPVEVDSSIIQRPAILVIEG